MRSAYAAVISPHFLALAAVLPRAPRPPRAARTRQWRGLGARASPHVLQFRPMPGRKRRSVADVAAELQVSQGEELIQKIMTRLREKPPMISPCWNLLEKETLMPKDHDSADQEECFPRTYTTFSKVPKSFLADLLQKLDSRFTPATIRRLAKHDRSIVTKLFYFALGISGNYPLPMAMRNKMSFKSIATERHWDMGSFLNQLVISEDEISWAARGAYTLLPHPTTSGAESDNVPQAFTSVVHASGAQATTAKT